MPESGLTMASERVDSDDLGSAAAAEALRRVAEVVAAGGVVAYPTETYYGLGADPHQPRALAAVLELKGRPMAQPLLLVLSDAGQLKPWVSHVPGPLEALARRFWPGPLTVVLPAAAGLPEALTGGRGTVALRVSSHPVARALVRSCGTPLTGTSANRTGAPAARTAAAVEASFGGDVSILDGGTTPGGPASTLLDLSVTPHRILRPGPVTAAAIEAVIGTYHRPR